jgi:carbon storage regulator CsrA
MLVLSRRPNEKIIFPTLQIGVQVVAIKPGVVRLGIEAPDEVGVFREEILDPDQLAALQARAAAGDAEWRQLRHFLRNRLNALGLGLTLLREQLRVGRLQESDSTLAKLTEEFLSVRQRLETFTSEPGRTSFPVTRRALLVEDDENERELLAGLLRMAGLTVDTAGDGCDALDYLRGRGRPDILLLDMVLPRCDGPSMVRTLRQDPTFAGLKIFAVSGHSPKEVGLSEDPTGVDRWFRKPIDPAILLRDLAQELERR